MCQTEANTHHILLAHRWNRARANATYATFVTDATYVRKNKNRKREKGAVVKGLHGWDKFASLFVPS